jgi:hypothetical protein
MPRSSFLRITLITAIDIGKIHKADKTPHPPPSGPACRRKGGIGQTDRGTDKKQLFIKTFPKYLLLYAVFLIQFLYGYSHPCSSSGSALTSEDVVFAILHGEVTKTFVTAQGAEMVDFALIRTWIMRITRVLPWLMQKNGLRGCRGRCRGLTMTGPSK